ncbi:MAG: hypothetical protein IIA45_09865 [Bacteroidetes bacterium]|nr:hypothetical protein [Bacteroidota bacterium]
MLLSFFNIKRKAAFVLYDELLDEMEWGEDRNKFKKRPSLETRIALKKFLNSTDLPFTSGIAGQTFYFALFLLLISVLIILFRVSSW